MREPTRSHIGAPPCALHSSMSVAVHAADQVSLAAGHHKDEQNCFCPAEVEPVAQRRDASMISIDAMRAMHFQIKPRSFVCSATVSAARACSSARAVSPLL